MHGQCSVGITSLVTWPRSVPWFDDLLLKCRDLIIMNVLNETLKLIFYWKNCKSIQFSEFMKILNHLVNEFDVHSYETLPKIFMTQSQVISCKRSRKIWKMILFVHVHDRRTRALAAFYHVFWIRDIPNFEDL